jgi:hypothetical protein
VKVVMLDHDGKAYVTIDETGGAEPLLSVASGDG